MLLREAMTTQVHFRTTAEKFVFGQNLWTSKPALPGHSDIQWKKTLIQAITNPYFLSFSNGNVFQVTVV